MLQKYAEAGQVGTLDVLDAVSLPKNAGHRRMARARRYAHRHHFDFTPRRGYIYVRSRAISSRCNDNFDEFPAEEIKKGYRTFIGKPVYVNHHNADIRRARGVIIDAALHEDTNPDGTEDTWAEVLMEVDAVRFPVLAREVKEGNIARTSMGTDVEYSVCTACGNKAYTPADYCNHIPAMKGMKIRRVNASTGRNEEVLIAERCYGLGFFENSLLVEDPADPTAFVLGVDDGNSISAAAAKEVLNEAERIVSEAAQTCSGSGKRGDAQPYNAKGRPMTLITCPDCGKEWRKTGQSGGINVTIPEHQSQKTASREAGIGDDFLDLLRGGRDPRNQCMVCGETFEWNGDLNGFFCPNGHDTAPVTASREAFRYDTNHNSYDKPYAGTRPKQETSAPGARTFHVEPGQGLGSDQHLREERQHQDEQAERQRRKIQQQHPESAEMLHNIEERRKERSQQRQQPRAASVRYASPLSEDWTRGWAEPSNGRVFDWGHRITPSRDFVRLYEGPEGHARFYDEFARQQGPDFPDIDDAFRWAEQVGWADPENSDMGDWGYAASRRTAAESYEQGHEDHEVTVVDMSWGSRVQCETCKKVLAVITDDDRTITNPSDIRYMLRDRMDGYTASRHVHSYGEQKAPAKVDTMRSESCPVCGDDEGYNGDKCNVCGYATPPNQFRDPDLTKAREMDLRQDQADEQGLPGQEIPGEEQQAEDLQCDQCGETFSAEGDATTGTEPSTEEAEETAEADPKHPDDAEDGDRPEADEPDDLSDLADKSDEELLGEDEDEEEWVDDEAEEVSDQDPATGEGRITGEPEGELDENGLEVPPEAEEAEDGLEEPVVAAGDTCPVCGEGTLVVQEKTAPVEEPELTEVGEDPAKANKVTSARRRGTSRRSTVDMNDRQPQRRQASPVNKAQQHRSRLIAAIREQQGDLDRANAQIGNLTRAVASLAIAAGLDQHPHYAGLVRQSGLRRKADGDQNQGDSVGGTPDTTTEQAKQPDATDDPTNVGAAPAPANKGVTPEGVTDVNNSDVAVNPPVLDNLQDVTSPTGGTDAPTPAAGDAQGATDITVGTPQNEAFDKPGDSGWKSSAKGTEVERFSSSLRLARLQIAAGLEPSTAEDLAVAQKIAATDQTLSEIDVQAATLERVTASQGRQASQDPAARRLVPRRAAQQGGVTPAASRTPSLQSTAGTPEGRDGEDQWLVGDPTV